jgi:hypothetical protein
MAEQPANVKRENITHEDTTLEDWHDVAAELNSMTENAPNMPAVTPTLAKTEDTPSMRSFTSPSLTVKLKAHPSSLAKIANPNRSRIVKLRDSSATLASITFASSSPNVKVHVVATTSVANQSQKPSNGAGLVGASANAVKIAVAKSSNDTNHRIRLELHSTVRAKAEPAEPLARTKMKKLTLMLGGQSTNAPRPIRSETASSALTDKTRSSTIGSRPEGSLAYYMAGKYDNNRQSPGTSGVHEADSSPRSVTTQSPVWSHNVDRLQCRKKCLEEELQLCEAEI